MLSMVGHTVNWVVRLDLTFLSLSFSCFPRTWDSQTLLFNIKSVTVAQ